MTLTIGLLLFLLFAASDSVQAQQSDSPGNPLTINTDLVVTWAQVLDRKDGKIVKGLEIGDFALREDGKPQQISLVKEGQPVSVIILVDGMRCVVPPELEFQRSQQALRQLGEDAEIALMAWDSDAVTAQPFTRDQETVAKRLQDRVRFFYALNDPRKGAASPVRPDRDHYRPGEAIYQATKYLEKAASPERRKVIIIIAWARAPLHMALAHRRTAAEVSKLVEKTGTTIYGLYLAEKHQQGLSRLFSGSPLDVKGKKRRNGGAIEQFVEQTGGSVLIGKPEEADDLLIRLTGLIRSSYTIGYYPENSDFDGGFRRISLELSPQGKAKVGKVDIKTRNGYRALRPWHRAEIVTASLRSQSRLAMTVQTASAFRLRPSGR
jgi:VWFA-related protein